MAVQITDRRDLPSSVLSGFTSTVGEPSLAVVDDGVLFSGNWYAGRSADGGASWQKLDPFTFFPPAGDGFCCDQTVLYDPSRDLVFWILQYIADRDRNTLRLAVNRGATLGDDSAWLLWDFVPDQIDPSWTRQWFDYNHAALSNDFLYLVTNTFTTTAPESFTRCVAFRVPLDDLASEDDPRVELFETTDFSLRCTQGATGTMYFGTHAEGSPPRVRVYRWDEGAASPSFTDVEVSDWVGGNGYSAPAPDGNDWLGRCDPRITAGWVADGVIGFGWSADRFGSRPFPHVRLVRIDEATFERLDEPDIWNSRLAFAYPEVCPNGRGEVGIGLFYGGGQFFPSHAVGAWNASEERWELASSRAGTNGPADGKWGDYVTVRPAHRDPAAWAAAGYVLDGGSDRDSIQPFLVRFAP